MNKNDFEEMLNIIEQHDEKVNHKKIYDKLVLIVEQIKLQEELTKKSEELQKLMNEEKED
jgi:hypothetical protein